MPAVGDQATPCRHPEAALLQVSYPCAAGAVIYKGTLVALTAGYAAAAVAGAGAVVVGVAEQAVDNTSGAAGAVRVLVASGNAFLLASTGVVAADVGKPAYLSDDITVADAAGTYGVVVGVIEELESTNRVWVYIPPTNALFLTGAQAAAVPTAAIGVAQHAITAGDITATHYDFTFAFTVAAFSVTFRSATGLKLAATNLVTINAGAVRVALDALGAPKLIATDIVAVVASA